jgi:hypothetical protein
MMIVTLLLMMMVVRLLKTGRKAALKATALFPSFKK